ncbi:restriction endonuclease subunit S [Enterococcus faecalis]|nr:restriction endonuclease subunit S [Enterococcus faecalis]EGO8318418.1 restriction endonuclease subunit S [Enterococcus faecalis]EJM6099359.1 restriction endonuclease subunit S [Enterococcus faecalis]
MCKLGKLAEFNPKSNLPEKFEYVDLESVVGTELVGHRLENRDSAPSRAQRLAKKNDVFYQTVRPYQKNNYLFDLPYDNYVFSTGYAQMRPSGNGYFLLTLVQEEKFVNRVLERSTGTSYPAINSNDLAKLSVRVPADIEEEQNIGKFFSNLDNLVTLHQRKLDQLKNLKNAFLQLMFVSNSPENSTVPKLRFANFTEEWELCGFFDTIENTIDFRGRTPKKLGLDWSDNGYLALSALNVKHGYIDSNIDAHYGNQELYDKWMSGKELRKGQVLFTTEAPMGNVAQIPDNTGYILSQRTIAFETKKNRITDDFLAVLLGSPKIFNELSSLSSGGTAKGISQKSLSQLRVQIPCSISEQKEIGIFFKQLNETITLHQNKLDQLKELKKSYLQNMFI